MLESVKRAETVELDKIPTVSGDPQDDKFLATPCACGANHLVSEDDDLLVLGSYGGAQVVRCASFLRMLERQQSQG